MFITFEGGEGSGKTTQIQMLKSALTDMGHDAVTTREPGGTVEAEKIRDLLVQRDGGDWTPTAEAMLFFTARHMHVETKIKPALAEDKIVICDRFTDSTIAYQGYGHGFDLSILKLIQSVSIGDFQPDLTMILDIDVTEGLARAGARMAGDNDATTEDRFERLKIDFHDNLRRGYLQIAKENPNRCVVINAAQSIDDVHNAILSAIKL